MLKKCPTCETSFTEDYSFCTEHGSQLVDDEITLPHYSITEPLVDAADVFVSHAPEDAATAAEIAAHLRAAGVRLALAQPHLTDWNRAALAASRVVLVACTDAAMRSGQVKQQLLTAWQMGKPFLPLRVGPPSRFAAQMDDWLHERPGVTIAQRPPAQWTNEVINALHFSNLAQPQRPAQRGLGAAPKAEAWDEITVPHQTLVLPRPAETGWAGLRWVAGFTDQMWPVAAGAAETANAPTVRGLGAAQVSVQHDYRVGGRVKLALESERAGYLTLINEGADGIIYCLCPSAGFAPDERLPAGRSYLPQTGA